MTKPKRKATTNTKGPQVRPNIFVACNIDQFKYAALSKADAMHEAKNHAAECHAGTNLKHLLDRHISISIQGD